MISVEFERHLPGILTSQVNGNEGETSSKGSFPSSGFLIPLNINPP